MEQSLFLNADSLVLFAHFFGVLVLFVAQCCAVIYGIFGQAHYSARENLVFFGAALWAQGGALAFIIISGAVLKTLRDFEPMGEMLFVSKLVLAAFAGINLAYMAFKFAEAKRNFLRGENVWLKENFVLIVYYFTPLNLVLTLIAGYIGLVMRLF